VSPCDREIRVCERDGACAADKYVSSSFSKKTISTNRLTTFNSNSMMCKKAGGVYHARQSVQRTANFAAFSTTFL
jgi:hypothetical protein